MTIEAIRAEITSATATRDALMRQLQARRLSVWMSSQDNDDVRDIEDGLVDISAYIRELEA